MWTRVRQGAPLVHCLTNLVVTITANVVLAIGAAPAMVVAREEVAEFAPIANAVSFNLGTLDVPQTRAIRTAVDAANDAGKPWIVDPVAVGPRCRFAQNWRSICSMPTKADASTPCGIDGIATIEARAFPGRGDRQHSGRQRRRCDARTT